MESVGDGLGEVDIRFVTVVDDYAVAAEDILDGIGIADKVSNKAVVIDSDDLCPLDNNFAAVLGGEICKVELVVGSETEARLLDHLLGSICF